MYKTKLQELCQNRQWALPKYSAMKDGPDHTPSFKSSVIVNGISFDSPFPSNSSKQSQNDAAKLAFLHFTSPPPSSSISSELDIQETYDELDTQYKSQLEKYAHWKDLDLPFYSSTTEVPSDALGFKATVTFDGHAFDSIKFYTTVKEAENAAAKAALMSMMAYDSQEASFLNPTPNFYIMGGKILPWTVVWWTTYESKQENSGFYKNSLQELAQKEGLSAPVYKTINTGAPHMPTFFSFVELEGERFYGKAGKTKKAAEVKAAIVAYTSLKEVAMSRSTEFRLESDFRSDLTTTVNLQHNIRHKDEFFSTPVAIKEEHSAESKDKVEEVVNLAETITGSLKIGSEDSMLSNSSVTAIVSNKQRMTGHKIATNSSNCPLLSSDTNKGKLGALESYLLCGRVRVYPSYPNISFPKGITVLPISDNKWVAVSLEFPNEHSH